jgi:hypothetical protein
MRQQLEDDIHMDKESVAKAPDKLKAGSTWKVFSEAMGTYDSQLLGSGHVPLVYVIRQNEILDASVEYCCFISAWSSDISC